MGNLIWYSIVRIKIYVCNLLVEIYPLTIFYAITCLFLVLCISIWFWILLRFLYSYCAYCLQIMLYQFINSTFFYKVIKFHYKNEGKCSDLTYFFTEKMHHVKYRLDSYILHSNFHITVRNVKIINAFYHVVGVKMGRFQTRQPGLLKRGVEPGRCRDI